MNSFELQESLKKTTKILAGKNIPVYMEGFSPRVEYDPLKKKPNAIFIPALPQNANKKLVRAIHGYIDHECSHISFSDVEDITNRKKSKLWRYLHNCIEDPRVNARMIETYSGSKKNIRSGYDYLFTELKDEEGTLLYSREYLNKLDASSPEAKAALHLQLASLWFAGKMNCSLSKDKFVELGLDDFYTDILANADTDMLNSLADVKTAEDVRKQADYWEGFFNEEILNKMQPDEGDGKPDGSDKRKISDEIADSLKTLEEQLAEAIEKEIKEEIGKSNEYFYWTDRFDETVNKKEVISRLPRNINLNVAQFEEEASRSSNFLSKDLRRLLEERRRRYYVSGYKSGKLNSKSLFSVKCGNDRVFKKKNEIRDVNACASLLVDMSGSMSGSRIEVAMKSAYAFAMTLQDLKVPFEIFGFLTDSPNSTMRREYNKFAAKNPDLALRVVNQDSPERFYEFKSFNEQFDILSKKAIAAVGNGGVNLNQNEDSKHVMLAMQRLSVRPEKVKALFVFSDGSPCFCAHDIKPSAAKLTSLVQNSKTDYGVDVYGIGINSETVKQYYKNNKVIKHLSDLPTALFDFLRKIF